MNTSEIAFFAPTLVPGSDAVVRPPARRASLGRRPQPTGPARFWRRARRTASDIAMLAVAVMFGLFPAA
jgi:hypothetical protein